MALLPWRTGKVIKTEDHNSFTRSYLIKVMGETIFDFKPGQFVTLDLPIHEKPNKRLRSYSISSWPDGTNTFELIIVLTPGGLGTTYLFNEIKTGDEIRFRGAQGVFTIPAAITKEMFFVCTGTGVAPFRSMIQHIRHQNLPFQKITLIYGCRNRENLLFYDELKALASDMPGFVYIPVLSREDWAGEQGHVHAVYEKLCADKPDTDFYLCGWKPMVDEARLRIREMGYPDKSVHLELYG